MAIQENDMDLVRKLHLELNGSGRRTRGTVQPPAKKVKRDLVASASAGLKETSSLSQSGSDSRDGGKPSRRENGTLKRLTKKQPDSDSNHHHLQEEDNTTFQNGRKEALEPQVSTKIASDSKKGGSGDGDVGSRKAFNLAEVGSIGMERGEELVVSLARSAAAREASGIAPRVKCFFQGSPYGVSLEASACASKQTLEAALREAFADEPNVASTSDVDIMIFDGEGKQSLCKATEPEDNWVAALKDAKRIYLTHSSAAAN